jgi:GMP synthase (glutamine-hydrolysing)
LDTVRAVAAASLVIVRHVPWEGPHRIAAALADVPQRRVDVLRGQSLPDPSTLAGAVLMGGPMSVNDTARYPDLAREKAWIAEALSDQLPLLGVCLGSQLIADVLGAEIVPARAPEIGWAPVTIVAPDDPLVGPLAPRSTVLHWHGEQFDTPPGATLLATSDLTACQAFRSGAAWGLLFHLEADERLTDRWLAEDAMADDARRALGPSYAEQLRAGARAAAPALVERSSAALRSFADLVRERRSRLSAA